MKKSFRIAVINSHPIQYFAPLYAYINQNSDLEITALYLSDFSIRGGEDPGFGKSVKWDIDLLSGYPSKFIGSRASKRTPGGFFSLIVPELWSAIRSGKFDCVWLHGHGFAANHLALAAAKSASLPIFMRGETHLGLHRDHTKFVLRSSLMRRFYRLCDRFLAIGSANADFYRAMGVPDSKIFLTPYTVDNERFVRAASAARPNRKKIRAELGINSDVPIILFASKFQRRKRPDDLVKAASRLAKEKLDFRLVMVGTGEMESELKALVTSYGLQNVSFPGFINQSRLPEIFAACDIFVLPSEDEPWGLIVNEAMCARMPVVAADEIGCVPDLVKHGETGFAYPTGRTDMLASTLRSLVIDPSLRDRMSQNASNQISSWSFRECALGIQAAVASLQTRKPTR